MLSTVFEIKTNGLGEILFMVRKSLNKGQGISPKLK
jgi:hypothetical protein